MLCRNPLRDPRVGASGGVLLPLEFPCCGLVAGLFVGLNLRAE